MGDIQLCDTLRRSSLRFLWSGKQSLPSDIDTDSVDSSVTAMTMRRIKSINQPPSTRKRSCLIIISLVIAVSFIMQGFLSIGIPKIDWSQTFSTRTNTPSMAPKRIVYGDNKQSLRCIVHAYGNGGRLGNQMFIIAAAYGLARLHSCHLHIATDPFTQTNTSFVLDLTPLLISTELFTSIVKDNSQSIHQTNMTNGCEYRSEMTRPNAIPSGSILTLRGYWQSYLHFSKYADDFRERIFVPTPPILRDSVAVLRSHSQRQVRGQNAALVHRLSRTQETTRSVDRCNMDRYSCATHGLRRHVIRVVRCLSGQRDGSFHRPLSRCSLHRGK